MYCKTYILLERDFRELRQNNFVGISASPVSDDMLKWEAEIEGLQDSMWQGLHFQLVLTFPSEYNHVPPVVKFTSIPFHPNVDPNTGRPSIDFLDNPARWNPSYTLSSILLALQVMLSNPMLENPVNLEASQTLVKNEYLYRNIIHTLSQEPGQETRNRTHLVITTRHGLKSPHRKPQSNTEIHCLKIQILLESITDGGKWICSVIKNGS
ncbi:ubiquitin-conjugating enzyme E2 U isoform X4 [Dipodomys merriami]|uniref:ubiquitin-conjugating enzyme E2 U isoform X4 n=1 Tax=Dipodomys merriami TaxID=94247 RepID=UPI00385598FE